MADPSSGSPIAWGYWVHWKGGVELLERVARAAVWAVGDEGGTAATSRVDVEVLGDCESFASPEEFRDRVSSQSLRRFDRITIVASSNVLDAWVVLVREAATEDWPPRGVLVWVGGRQAGTEAACRHVRASIAGALRRGVPDASRAPPLTGDSGDGRDPEVAIRDSLAPAKAGIRWVIAVAFAATMSLIIFPAVFAGFATVEVSPLPTATNSPTTALLTTGVLPTADPDYRVNVAGVAFLLAPFYSMGMWVWGSWATLRPSVALAGVRRVLPIEGPLRRLLSVVVGGVVGILIRLALSEMGVVIV